MHSLQEFFEIYDANIHREGAQSLKEWLVNSTLEKDPASTKYHGNFAGGLIDHSVNVYYQFRKLLGTYKDIVNVSDESVAIMALLHDVCKIGKYALDFRNVKENGVWISKPYYKFNDMSCLGYHGPQSVWLIQEYMRLTREEIAAIANHMGAYDRSPSDFELNQVYEKWPAAFLLHVADNAASIFDEITV